jgi:hypothetical protein
MHTYCIALSGSGQIDQSSLCSPGRGEVRNQAFVKLTSPDFHKLRKTYPAKQNHGPRHSVARALTRFRRFFRAFTRRRVEPLHRHHGPKLRAHQIFFAGPMGRAWAANQTGDVPRRQDSIFRARCASPTSVDHEAQPRMTIGKILVPYGWGYCVHVGSSSVKHRDSALLLRQSAELLAAIVRLDLAVSLHISVTWVSLFASISQEAISLLALRRCG